MSETQFETESVLSVVLDRQSMQNARQEVEQTFTDVGNVTVDTSGGTATVPDGGTSGAASGFDGGSLETLADERNDYLEEMVDLLDDGTAVASGSGGGGGGAGGTLLQGLGVRSLLGGASVAGGATALGAGGIALGGGVIGSELRGQLQELVPESFASPDEQVSGTSYAWTEEDGLGGSAEPVLSGDMFSDLGDLDLSEPDWVGQLTEFQWPDFGFESEFENLDWPELPKPSELNSFWPDLPQASGIENFWPNLPDPSNQGDFWPSLPEPPEQDFWPDIPNPLDPGGGNNPPEDNTPSGTPGRPGRTEGGYGPVGERLDINMDGRITIEDARDATKELDKKFEDWKRQLEQEINNR